ncbi:MAG TPA: hypothetical protein VF546_10855 [Pyrinomonadaceae bacterium]|jgi:hypothetical protein
MRKLILAFVLLVTAAAVAAADTIYLKDGRTVRGTVIGFINNRFAVRVTPTTGQPGDEGEIRFFRPGEIDRVELDGRSLDELRYESRTVQVSLAPNWIDSGIDVRRNERIQIRASGTISTPRARITPDGLRSTDPTAPLPRAAEGVLIGAVGSDADSPIVELGLQREFVADRDGRLYLTANRGTYTDARGAFTVQVRRERDLTPRRNTTAGRDTTGRDDDTGGDDDLFGGSRSSAPAPVRSRTPRTAPPDTGRDRAPQEITVEVPGTSRGTDTNIELRTGDQVTISASGRVVAGRRAGEVGPEGGRAGGFGAIAGTYPVPNAGPGALIGFIRLANGQVTQPFLVGAQQTFNAPADGRLFLAINDDNYGDNGGSFTVRIRY